MHGDCGGGALGLRGVEVTAAFFEDVDEELLDAAGVFGSFAVAELVDDDGEGAGHFVFVEAGAAHGVADADARRRRGRYRLSGDRGGAAAATGEDCARLRLLERVLGRDALLAGRLRSFAALRMTERFRGRALLILLWREQVLDGSVVLAGRSGTFLTCLPAVAGRAPTVSFGDCLPAAAFLTAAHVDDDDTATGADDFTARADGAGFASCADDDGAAADDFAERAEDDEMMASRRSSWRRRRYRERVFSRERRSGFHALALGFPAFTFARADFLGRRGADVVAASVLFFGHGIIRGATGRRLEIAAGARCC